jgi:hypothetical protein
MYCPHYSYFDAFNNAVSVILTTLGQIFNNLKNDRYISPADFKCALCMYMFSNAFLEDAGFVGFLFSATHIMKFSRRKRRRGGKEEQKTKNQQKLKKAED